LAHASELANRKQRDWRKHMNASDILIGVDGCSTGWIAASMRADGVGGIAVRVVPRFADLAMGMDGAHPSIIAVDMPIGLPAQIVGAGRGPEQAVRQLLGARKSSVFAIPSRRAVEAEPGPFSDPASMYAAHQRVCEIARATSHPPKGASIQAFHIFPKIREVDLALRSNKQLAASTIEVHPEVAFWRLNNETALAHAKKIKGVVNPEGLAERRALLIAAGLAHDAVMANPPRGAKLDDLIDALACLCIAFRYYQGSARPFPDPPQLDEHGLRVAIWA
jgi:threonine dehydratase